jgi:hypothetical protein
MESLSHDVGTVLAGQEAAHTFRVKNASKETIAIQEEKDIQQNCGCSAIEAAMHSLMPDEATDVTVRVRTNPTGGLFNHGGRIIWTSSSGSKRTVVLSLKGNAIPAIASQPEVLEFGPSETLAGVTKSVAFSSDFAIDWPSFAVNSSSDHFQITDRTIAPNGARCTVLCRLPEGTGRTDAYLRVTARMREGAWNPSGGPLSAMVPLSALQKVDLQVSPKALVFDFGGRDVATAKLMLSGERLAKAAPLVEAVLSPCGIIDWKLLQGAKGSTLAIMELTLRKSQNQGPESGASLIIKFRGGGSIRVPLVLINKGQKVVS